MLSSRAQDNMHWFKGNFARQIGHANPNAPEVIDMTIAENWLIREDIIQTAKEAVAAEFSDEHLSYSSGMGGDKDVLEATAGFFNRFFQPRVPVQPEHLVVGAGCSAILDSLLYSLCEVDEGVLIEAPFWGSFSAYGVLRNNVHLVPVHVPKGTSMIEAYEQALSKAPCKIRAILFCNPHNPRGQLYSPESIKALFQFCQTHDLHFISDEIYGLSTFGTSIDHSQGHDDSRRDLVVEPLTSTFTSVLQLDLSKAGVDVDMHRIHVITSVSKDFGSSGLRMGFLVTQANTDLRFAMAIYNNAKVSNMTALVVKWLFSNHIQLEQTIQRNIRRLHSAATVVIDFMHQHSIPFYRPVAGVYVWARLGGSSATDQSVAELQKRFVDVGVRVGPGSEYGEQECGWFRVTFALPRPQLLEGLRRIETALELQSLVSTRTHFRDPKCAISAVVELASPPA